MKVFIVIQTVNTWDGWHGTTSTSIIGVFLTKELAELLNLNSIETDESGVEWHIEECDIMHLPLASLEDTSQESDEGYDDSQKAASAGIEEIILDGIKIDSPEAVAEHMEKFLFHGLPHIVISDYQARTVN